MLPAKRTNVSVPNLRDILFVLKYLPAGGLIQRSKNIEQRGLA